MDDEKTYQIIGAAMEVHRHLGCGFLESVYQDAMAMEFQIRGIPFDREKELPIVYKSRKLPSTYRVDFVCFGSVIVELKALSKTGGAEEAQIINYLKASGFGIALLIIFGAKSLEHKRFIFSQSAKSAESVDAPHHG